MGRARLHPGVKRLLRTDDKQVDGCWRAAFYEPNTTAGCPRVHLVPAYQSRLASVRLLTRAQLFLA